MCADLSRTQRNLLVCERSSFLDEKNRVSSQMEQLRFNYKVSVLLPEYDSAPSHLESILNSFSSFYLIKQLPLYELLDKDFLQSAVYQGSVYGLSFRTRIDEDNCVALMPNGHLVFSLDKDAFETLGLEGRPSRSNRTSSRYEVTVDLRDGSMAPGGRSYLRLRRALMSHLKLQMDFLISHHPGGGASLRPLLSRCDWLERRPEVSRRGLSRLVRPALRSCDPHDLLEWIGAVDAAVSLENSSSDFLSTLTCLEPEATVSQAMSMSACGLLLPQDLQHLVEELRCYLQQAQTDSWASVTVHGFTDSPVSWGDGERNILTGGHDLYNLLMFPDHTYRLHLATGAQKTCPP